MVPVTDVGQPTIPRDYKEAVDQLDDLTSRFAESADRVRHWDALVPACPRWTIRKLVIHLGSIHAWAMSCIGVDHEPDFPRFVDHGEALPQWYRHKAAGLVARLRETPPDAPAWTLWGGHVAAFWARRQVHEATVHGVDLATALEASGEALPESWPISPELALDGLREVVDGFYPRQLRLGRSSGLPGTVRFEVQTEAGAPVAAIEALGVRYTEIGSGEPHLANIPGTAEQLYLAVWGRVPFPCIAPEIATIIREARLTP